jgi:hypothetical protein
MTVSQIHAPNTEQSASIARRFFEATASGDASAIDLLAEDVTWQLAHPEFASRIAELIPTVTAPASGVWKGRQSVMTDLIAPFVAVFVPGSLSTRLVEVIADGVRAVVILHVEGRLAGGGSYENDYCIRLVIRDNRIAAVTEYFDTLRWVEMIGDGIAAPA